ncbi:MAG: hypothetical protein HC796_04225 [Synechococcaceae cyanobacterium RL_1_2]|nr:hypothetical protein [Synechococcaceae cyanobacterium RL_1_2]
MPKDRDIQQIDSVMRQYHIQKRLRRRFSEFIHDHKAEGFYGNKNDRGDFTYQELCHLAKEFLEDQEG